MQMKNEGGVIDIVIYSIHSIYIMKLLLTILLLITTVNSLITCKDCKTTFGVEVCEKDCEGDICYLTETFPSYATNLVTRSIGCILGAAPPILGCRYNQDGQKLCLCDTELCNGQPNSINNYSTPIRLQPQACDCASVHPNKPNKSFLRPCAASFCVYQRTEIQTINNMSSVSYSTGCSMSTDFDLFNSNSKFFFYPETCVREEASIGYTVTACYTTNNQIQIGPLTIPSSSNLTTCISGSSFPFGVSDPFTTGNCTGEFCVISVRLDKSVHRGCLTTFPLGETDPRRLTNGYYKDVDGREQWLCSGVDHCNGNLSTLMNSWPEELASYVNLSLSSPSYLIIPSLRELPPQINSCTTNYLTNGFTQFMLMLSGLFNNLLGGPMIPTRY